MQADVDASLIQTMDRNAEGFTKRQVSNVNIKQSAYSIVVCLFPRNFEHMVWENMIKNFLITVAYVKNSHTIFEPDVGSLCGEIVQQSTTI